MIVTWHIHATLKLWDIVGVLLGADVRVGTRALLRLDLRAGRATHHTDVVEEVADHRLVIGVLTVLHAVDGHRCEDLAADPVSLCSVGGTIALTVDARR